MDQEDLGLHGMGLNTSSSVYIACWQTETLLLPLPVPEQAANQLLVLKVRTRLQYQTYLRILSRVHRRNTMRYNLFENQRNEIILLARILLMILFIISGWGKMTNFGGTVAYLDSLGAPMPMVAAGVAVVMEFFVAIAIVVGFYTRPLAFLFALFVLGTALIGHHFWTMVDPERATNMVQYFKNLSIMGGLLLLGITGPGKYSVDGR